MKKIIVLFGGIGILFSCKPKDALVSTSVERKTQVALKGDWVITSVSYPGSEYFKMTAFEVADSKCFEGSQWHLVSNNDSGTLALNKSGCPSYTTDLKWYITKDNQFVLKLIKEGEKPRKVLSGYVLAVANVSENSFQLVDKAQVGNNTAKVVYQFNRKK